MTKPDPRTTNGTARRRIRRLVKAQSDHCALCGLPVDKTLNTMPGQHSPRCVRPDCPGCVPHPMRAEVDEIIPVSKGGNPLDLDNCQLTHRICNLRKGNGTRDERAAKLTVTMRPVTTSTEW